MLLADWYVTCCLGLEPDVAEAYLGISEVLDEPETDDEVLTIALHELEKAGLWQRAALAPRLIELLGERVDDRDPVAIGARGLVLDLAASSGDHPAVIEALMEQVLLPGGARRLEDGEARRAVSALWNAAKLLNEEEKREVVAVPYLDLPETLDGVLVLAAARALFLGGGEVFGADDQEETPVARLLQEALKGGWGRLGWRLAFEQAASFTVLGELFGVWHGLPRAVPHLEPDLLETAARVLFRPGHERSATEAARDAMAEAVSFEEFDRRLRVALSPDGSLKTERDVLQRFGSTGAPDGFVRWSREAWSRALWQGTLWLRASDLDPAAMAAEVAEAWTLPDLKVLEHKIEIPVPARRAREHERSLGLVIGLHNRPDGKRPKVTTKAAQVAAPELGRELLPVHASPWLDPGPAGGRNAWDQTRARYPRALDPGPLGRLAAAVPVAARVLNLDNLEDGTQPILAAILVHATDVLRAWGRTEQERVRRALPIWQRTLLDRTDGLRHHVLAVAKEVGGGGTTAVDPATIVNADSIAGQREDAAALAFRRAVPSVAVAWVADTYPRAPVERGYERWFAELPRLIGRLQELRDETSSNTTRPLDRPLLDACLLTRFLTDADERILAPQSWREAFRERRWTRGVEWRRLMLARDNEPEELSGAQWAADDERDHLRHVARAVLATERIGSLPAAALRQGNAWLDDWRRALADLQDLHLLDRFLRLRLVELVDAPVVAQDIDDQLSIVAVILEAGSALDLDRLLHRIYGLGSPDEARTEVRRQVVKALVQAVFSGTPEGPGIVTPRQRLQERHRDAVLHTWLARVAARDEELCALLARGIDELRARRTSTLRRAKARVMESRSERWLEAEIEVADRRPLAAVCDPDRDRVEVVLEDREPIDKEAEPPVLDVFTDSTPGFWSDRSDDVRVRAVVVDLGEEQLRNGNRMRRVGFNAGQGLVVVGWVDASAGFAPGDLVEVTLFRGEDQRWHVGRPAPAAVPPRWRPGNVAWLLARRQHGDDAVPGLRWFVVESEDRLHALSFGTGPTGSTIEMSDWGLAHLVEGRKAIPAEQRHLGWLDEDGSWCPLPSSTLSLLAHAVSLPTTARVLVMGELEGSRGLRLSWAFGRVADVPWEDFDSTSADRLRAAVEKDEVANGIWLGVHVREVSDGVRIALTEDGDAIDRSFLDWVEAIEPEAVFDAVLGEEGAWSVLLDGAGGDRYPNRIPVQWRYGSPPRDATSIEAEISEWDPVRGRVTARLTTKKISGDEAAFLEEWLNRKEGAVLVLRQIGSRRKQKETCRGWTVNNLPVEVEVASVALDDTGQDDPFPHKGVEAHIEYLGPWRPARGAGEGVEATIVRGSSDRIEAGSSGPVVVAPRKHPGAGRWEILLNGTDGPQRLALEPDADAARRVRPNLGDRVTLRELAADRAVLDIEWRRTIVSVLWRLSSGGGGKRWPVNAKLHRAEGSRESVTLRHQALGRALLHQETGREPLQVRGARVRPAGPPHHGGQAVHVTWGRGRGRDARQLVAWTRRSGHELRPGRYDVRMELDLHEIEVDAGQVWRLRRFAHLTPAARDKKARASESEVEAFREALDLGLPVTVDFDLGGTSVRLRGMRNPRVAQGEDPRRVPLAPADGPFVHRQYPGTAQVLLREAKDGTHEASMRGVPPADLEAFLGSLPHVKREEPFGLDAAPLVYVGPERADPSTGATYSDLMERFEQGYGKTVLIPRRQLAFDGRSLEQHHPLFHGDSVRRAVWRVEHDETSVLDIVGVWLRFSQGRRLYQQAKQYQIVHILRVQERRSEPVISGIDMLDEGRIDQASRTVGVHGAHLDQESRVRVLALLRDQEEHGTEGLILGRLHIDAFENPERPGRDLVFTHVAPTFKSEGGLVALRTKERLFMRVSEVAQLPNDTAARLEPLDLLDAGRARRMGELLVLRRHFSVREDLLPAVQRRERSVDANILTGSIVLVRLTLEGERLQARVVDQRDVTDQRVDLPCREVDAFASHLAHQGNELAAVVGRSAKRLVLELRPGVFVALPSEKTEGLPAGRLTSGSVIQVHLKDGPHNPSFGVRRAVDGDETFVSKDGRPALLLPMNRLMKKDGTAGAFNERFWARAFSVAGLPGVVPAAVWRQSGSEVHEGARAAVELMRRQPFERVGLVLRRRNTELFNPGTLGPEATAGRLVREDRHALLVEGLGGGPKEPISWRAATWMEDTASAVWAQVSRHRWTIHDDFSVSWTGEEVLEVGPRRKLRSRSGKQGPLFFARGGPGHSLRYPTTRIRDFAYPYRELVDALHRTKRGMLWATVAAAEPDRVWVELAPGRVAELPGSVALARPAGARDWPLDRMKWDQLQPGDRLQLAVVASSPLAVDRIVLRRIDRSERARFGSAWRIVLPLREVDVERGGLTLGAGDVRMTVPASGAECEDLRDVQVVSLDGAGRLEALPSKWKELVSGPWYGASTLVVLHDSHLAIAGIDGVEAVPDLREGQWERDPLAEVIRDRTSLNALVEALGALPVTLTGYDPNRNLVFFDRRDQVGPSSLRPGDVLAAVVGPRVGPTSVVLGMGVDIRLVPADLVLAGVSGRARDDALGKLQGTTVWFHVAEDGCLRPGFVPSGEAARTRFAVLSAVRVEHHPEASGVVALGTWSATLHWMPVGHLAWRDLSLPSALERWVHHHRTVRARIVGGGRASPMLHEVAEREFNHAARGEEIAVEAVRDREGEVIAYRSAHCRMWLEVEDADPRLDAFAAVVTRRAVEVPRGVKARPRNQYVPRFELPCFDGSDTDPRPSDDSDAVEVGSRLDLIIAAYRRGDEVEARHLLDDLLSRASSSLHLDPLIRLGLRRLEDFQKASGARRRLLPILKALRDDPKRVSPTRERVEGFCRRIELWSGVGRDFELDLLAASLRIATGRWPQDINLLLDETEVVGELVRLARIVPREAAPVGDWIPAGRVPRTIREDLLDLRKRIGDQEFWVGPALPPWRTAVLGSADGGIGAQ